MKNASGRYEGFKEFKLKNGSFVKIKYYLTVNEDDTDGAKVCASCKYKYISSTNSIKCDYERHICPECGRGLERWENEYRCKDCKKLIPYEACLFDISEEEEAIKFGWDVLY